MHYCALLFRRGAIISLLCTSTHYCALLFRGSDHCYSITTIHNYSLVCTAVHHCSLHALLFYHYYSPLLTTAHCYSQAVITIIHHYSLLLYVLLFAGGDHCYALPCTTIHHYSLFTGGGRLSRAHRLQRLAVQQNRRSEKLNSL